MIIHEHKIYGFCRWLRIGAILLGMALAIAGTCKLFAFPEPLEIGMEHEIIERNIEIEIERSVKECMDRLERGVGTYEDADRVMRDIEREKNQDCR